MIAAGLLALAGPASGCPAGGRWPQPIQAGALIGRTVLQPTESQTVLGQVRAVVAQPTGVAVVVAVGGWWGWGARPVAVPLGAMTLLGRDMEIVDLSPRQLEALPDAVGGTTVPEETSLCVGLSRPSH